jgi:hypothetical protein
MPKITSTREQHVGNVTILVYGQAGTGKTMMMGTADNPLIIDVEHGLLSLVDRDLDSISVSSMDDFRSALIFSKSPEASHYGAVCIDSLSELAEIILSEEKERSKDPRLAYMALNDTLSKVIRTLKSLGKLVYCTAKADLKNDDGTGLSYFSPSFPGSKLSNQISYKFDIVGALRADADRNSGDIVRYVQTVNDGRYIAKDRTGKLDARQAPDISEMVAKIFGGSDGIS